MNNIKISLITITYNNPDLKRTLESVLLQDINHEEIEHIIVDNLSTDGTKEIVESYVNKVPFEVKYIRESDDGRYDAMNKGIKEAQGKYLCFMNAGDHFFDEKSLNLIASSNMNKDIVYGNCNIINNGKESVYSPPDVIDIKYFFTAALPHQATIIKKKIFNKIGYYDESLKIVADWKFFLLAINKYACSYLHLDHTISTYYFDGISSQVENRKLIEAEKNRILNAEFSQIQKKNVVVKNSKNDSFDTPILFLIFNRPEVTKEVFEEVKKIKPKYLFIAADGPRREKSGEYEECQNTRKIIDQIDWDCEVKTLFRNVNFGCGNGVSKAITWFFDNVESGIILEDDCLPDQTFFAYCEKMLLKYNNDDRISHINGTTFVSKYCEDRDSYYFSKYYHVWGWATWRSAWEKYDFSMRTYPEFKTLRMADNVFENKVISDFWLTAFEKVYNEEIDTWDYQWVYTNFINNSLSIMPFRNLISNIGFGIDATHTVSKDDKDANRELEQMNSIIKHPSFLVHNKTLDNYIYESHLGVVQNKKEFDVTRKKGKCKSTSSDVFIKSYHKIKFALCSPKQFIKKYLNLFLNSKIRQPIRKMWYLIRFKHMK